MASPYDKTLPIQLHETWPGVPGPSCLGPWTGNQGPTPYVSAFSVAGAQFALDGLAWTAVRGPSHDRLAQVI